MGTRMLGPVIRVHDGGGGRKEREEDGMRGEGKKKEKERWEKW